MELLKKTYRIDEYSIDIFFTPEAWKIPSSPALEELVKNNPGSFYTLYELLQKEHESLYGRKMDINRRSFTVELWAHLFAEKFLLTCKKYCGFEVFEKLIDQVLKRTAMIDCGEEHADHNRKLWDMLAKVYNPVDEDNT